MSETVSIALHWLVTGVFGLAVLAGFAVAGVVGYFLYKKRKRS